MSTSAKEKVRQRGRKNVKAGVSIFTTTRGRNWYCNTSSRCYIDLARATLTQDVGYRPIYPGPYVARTKSKQAKLTQFYNFADRISFAEHGKLVAESSEFHSTLSRAHRAHFFQPEIRK